jgi:ABC-type branched-subunit amino acid transport system ATPase component
LAELVVEKVSVRFGGIRAVHEVSLAVTGGEVHGLIGPNGAGKTTLFNVITGTQAPTYGDVRFDGRMITNYKPYRRARLGLARTFQRLEVCGSLTARENVMLAAEAQPHKVPDGMDLGAWADHLLEKVGISAIAGELADALPTGTARLVELTRALATSPSVLLVDEPSSGLDAAETTALGAVLAELAASGMAVLLVEHDLSLVHGICQRLTVLDYGEVIASGDPVDVRADSAVQAAYLGTPAGPASQGGATQGGARAVPISVATPPVDRAEPMIAVSDVHAAYGRIEVVHGVTLAVAAGGVCALLGPNGAGKSTLLKVLSGRMAPTSGQVSIGGQVIKKVGSDSLARQGICAIPEGRAVFPNLTVAENLMMCTYRGRSLALSQLADRTYERFPRLAERRRQLAGDLSGGEQQMLALARALYTEPKVLLLDEISMGLAPLIVEELYTLVGELARTENLTVVLVEQYADAALALATEAVIMVNGTVAHAGTPQEIQSRLVESYLGAN